MTYANIVDTTLGQLADVVFYNQILANLRASYNPPSVLYTLNEGSNPTTTGTSFADVLAPGSGLKLSLSLTLDAAADVLIGFSGAINLTGSGNHQAYFDLTVDGVRQGGDDGILQVGEGGATDMDLHASFTWLIQSVTAGTRIINLQWKSRASGLTVTLYAGAGTAAHDIHPQFWAKKC